MVKVLNRRAAGSFDEVVDGADQDDSRPTLPDGYIDVVGPRDILRRGHMRDDPHKTLDRIIAQ
jgi:hypothetical protein